MTEQLYRWVNCSQPPKKESYYRGFRKDNDIEINLHWDGDNWYIIRGDAEVKIPEDQIERYFFNAAPSLNAGSLEQDVQKAAEKYAQRKCRDCNSGVSFEGGCVCGILEEAFLAGAAYVKGGEEKGEPIFNTLKPVSSDKLLAEYSKLRPANEDRDKDYSPLMDLFMNEICAHLKLYTNPEVFQSAWTASLFPERVTKACLRATEQYIDSLSSRPSLDIVKELREANPWLRDPYHGEQGMAGIWSDCCNKLSELLNQKEAK